jgi:hypothetical protein
VSLDLPSRDDDSGETDELDRGDLLERAIVVASVLLLAGTIGFVAWQATGTSPGADPVATVEEVEATDDDRLRVVVGLENRRSTGLSSVRVGVRCGSAERSLEFTHVPAGGYRTGTVVCPAGTTPDASVESWVET